MLQNLKAACCHELDDLLIRQLKRTPSAFLRGLLPRLLVMPHQWAVIDPDTTALQAESDVLEVVEEIGRSVDLCAYSSRQ